MKWLKKARLCAFGIMIVALSGCAGLLGESIGSGNKGRLLLSTDAAGLEQFGRILHGSERTDSPFWAVQHDSELTKRNRFKVIPGGEK